MKKQLILSLVVMFTLALFTPAIVNAMDNSTVIVNVEGDEKKADKKAEAKPACTATAKPACSEAKKADAKPCCAEKKADCAEKKTECTKKAEEKK